MCVRESLSICVLGRLVRTRRALRLFILLPGLCGGSFAPNYDESQICNKIEHMRARTHARYMYNIIVLAVIFNAKMLSYVVAARARVCVLHLYTNTAMWIPNEIESRFMFKHTQIFMTSFV